MQAILEKVNELRKGAPIVIDYHNSNRYRLVVKENNETKTAYYFSTPIYNRKTGKIIDFEFQSNDGAIFLTGSNTNITVSNRVLMENAEGYCSIELPQKCSFVSSQEVRCGNIILLPTANGVAFKCGIKSNEKTTFVIDVGSPFLHIRANDKCFALMKEQFKPFAIFSCIGALDEFGDVIGSAKIEYQKLTESKYRVVVSTVNSTAKNIILEANLYENKLFQDTTVESMNPYTNNAFGSIAYIGNTNEYGEQWLYSRLDYSRIPEIMDKQIQKAILHMPKFDNNKVKFRAYKVAARFCSFGSNWENRIAGEIPISDSFFNSDYQSIDLTSLLIDQHTKTFTKSEGLILKPQKKGAGFSAVSTADSYLAPQIIEINYI